MYYYFYDNNGNMTRITPKNGIGFTGYQYNQRNLLTNVYEQAGITTPLADYVYDGAGDRVQQIVDGVTTTYANDPTGLTQVLLADSGKTQTAQLYGLDLIEQDDGTGMRLLLADGLGSVRQEMANGAVDVTTTYAPYGKVLAQTGTSGTVYGYTGEQEDDATGLVYLRARYYSPYLNQFQSRDPFAGYATLPQSQNGYSYADNNPVNYTDPAGLARIKIWAAAFISPPSINFPIRYSGNPLLSNVNATFEGDGRSFYAGGTPSSRVWHEVELDTSNPAYYILSNRTDTGVTRASWKDALGRYSYYATGKAPADIEWQGSSIFVHMEAHASNPLALGAPAIDYRYTIQFDLFEGEVTLFGYHDWYPWHELYLEVDGVAVRRWPVQYSPIGSVQPENPFALGYLPQPVEYTRKIPGLKNNTVQNCVSPLTSSLLNTNMNDAFREWAWLTLLLD